MISFIVIGKNEGAKLNYCFNSIGFLVQKHKCINFELIYVDSNSTDDSIEIAKKHDIKKIFIITENANAAIARNIGAIESEGDILFFIDGDMEINNDIIKNVLDKNNNLKYDCVTGHLDDLLYSSNGKLFGQFPRTYNKTLPVKEENLTINGGVFLIKRAIWLKVGGMSTKYRRSQDLDLSLRLKKNGIKTIRVPNLIAIHHTIDYQNEKRMWKLMLSGDLNYSALILREHFLDKELFMYSIRSNYTSILFLIMLVSFFFSKKIILASTLLYFVILLFRGFKNTIKVSTTKHKLIYFLERISYQILRDFLFWFAIMFFHPPTHKLKYITLSSIELKNK